MIPGLGRSAGEGVSYPLKFLWTSLVAQLVKNPLAMWETWVRFLDCEDPLEKGKATHSSVLTWRILWTVVRGVAKSEQIPLHIPFICLLIGLSFNIWLVWLVHK